METEDPSWYSLHFDNETFTENHAAGIESQFWDKTRFYFRVVGSCNGLVCLSDDLFGYTDTVILWNPSIRQAFTLPVPRFTFDPLHRHMFALGFGVDPNTNNHKVVRMNYLQGRDRYMVPLEVEVFSLCSGSWRGIETTSPYCVPERFWSQGLINGVVHWVAYHLTKKSGFVAIRSLVMSFNMGGEEFGELNLPGILVNECPEEMSTAVFGGSLTIVWLDGYGCRCSVWVMKEYGVAESWSNQFNIGGLGLALGLRRNGEILLATTRGELVSHNYGTRRRWNNGKCGTKDSFHVDSYTESLILLTEVNNARERGARMLRSASCSSEEDLGWKDDAMDTAVEKNEGWMQPGTVQFLIALILLCWPAVFSTQSGKKGLFNIGR